MLPIARRILPARPAATGAASSAPSYYPYAQRHVSPNRGERMRNLLVHLRARGPEELRRIADCWGVALTGRTTDDHVAHLYRTMRDPWAVRDRAEVLRPVEWAIIDAILALPANTGLLRDSVAAVGGFRPAEIAAAAGLAACGILAADDGSGTIGLPRELATAFARVRDERLLGPALDPATPLRGLLATLEGGELEEAAAAWGLRVTPGTVGRDALTDDLLARLDLPEQRRAVVADLSGEAARIFAALREAGGELTLAAVREQLGLSAPVLREALRALNRRLLVWHVWEAPAPGGGALGRSLIVPRDVLARRRPARDEPPPLAPVAAAPSVQPQHPFSAAWDLLTILQRLAQGRLAWREGDEERNATALRRLAPALWRVADDGRARPGYVPFLLALARWEGLIQVEDEELAAREPALERWRGRDFPDQTRALFARWRASAEWPEGLSQDDLQLTNVDWPTARGAILAELQPCAVGTWYDAATLATRIARLRPQLLGGSFHAARASGPAGSREEVTSAAVAVALHGALVPLGLLREGAMAGQGKRPRAALALTEVGAWLLGQRPAPPTPVSGPHPLAIGADFEVLLFRPTPRRLWTLGALAEQVRLDTASVYRLGEASVRRGIASGLSAEQIVTFLERGSGGSLPQNVAFTLREWTRGHEGVRLTRALIARPDTAASLDRLRVALERAGLPAPELLPDGRLLLPLPAEGDPEPIVALLRDAGFTPRWARS